MRASFPQQNGGAKYFAAQIWRRYYGESSVRRLIGVPITAGSLLIARGANPMYIVHVKRYSVAQARIHFSHLLDAAEAGDAVVIERRGTRFRLETERKRQPLRRRARPPSLIEYVDPIVLQGQWTWKWAEGGLRFIARRKRR
jgi:hypothetical protein